MNSSRSSNLFKRSWAGQTKTSCRSRSLVKLTKSRNWRGGLKKRRKDINDVCSEVARTPLGGVRGLCSNEGPRSSKGPNSALPLSLTREGGRGRVPRKDKVEIGNSSLRRLNATNDLPNQSGSGGEAIDTDSTDAALVDSGAPCDFRVCLVQASTRASRRDIDASLARCCHGSPHRSKYEVPV